MSRHFDPFRGGSNRYASNAISVETAERVNADGARTGGRGLFTRGALPFYCVNRSVEPSPACGDAAGGPNFFGLSLNSAHTRVRRASRHVACESLGRWD
jgi:hypothetical protein